MYQNYFLSQYVGFLLPLPLSLSHSAYCFDPAPSSYPLLGTTPKPFPPNLLRSTACMLTPLCPPSLFCWLAVPLSPSFLPNPASTLLWLALTRGVCVSPLQCWVALCPSGSHWRLSLPGLRFSPPDLGGMNFSTRPWWFFFWVSNCQFQFWPRRNAVVRICPARSWGCRVQSF